MDTKKEWKRFWDFLKEDSWKSLLVNLVLAFIIIKFVVFPLLIFLTGTPLPLVIVESCSMHHDGSLGDVLENGIYYDHDISLENTSSWNLKNGFNKGDIIFVTRAKNLEVGDVIVFDSGGRTAHPVIHRIISLEDEITTKGDNNPSLLPFERGISKEQVLGKAVFRIRWLGWVKLIFFDWQKSPSERGFCV